LSNLRGAASYLKSELVERNRTVYRDRGFRSEVTLETARAIAADRARADAERQARAAARARERRQEYERQQIESYAEEAADLARELDISIEEALEQVDPESEVETFEYYDASDVMELAGERFELPGDFLDRMDEMLDLETDEAAGEGSE
jgi:hypothetical protein